MAIVTATVDQRQHRTPHLTNVQLVVGATSPDSMTDAPTLSSTQVAAIRKQLLAANTRLVAIERERRELKERIAALVAQLKRDER